MSKPVFGLLAGLAVLAAAPVVLRRAGSRAIYGMGPDTAGRTLRLGFGEPRSHAGEALNDYHWHPQRALTQFAASKKRGGSRATAPDLEKVMRDAIRRVTGREPYDVRVRSPEGAERWTDQPVPEDAVLFVIHDGGDLSLYGDPAPRRQVQKALAQHGYHLMEDSHVYSFVVPI